jgi:hypothetical protein
VDFSSNKPSLRCFDAKVNDNLGNHGRHWWVFRRSGNQSLRITHPAFRFTMAHPGNAVQSGVKEELNPCSEN